MTVLMYIFVHLVTELFDTKTRKEWKTSLRKTFDLPSYEDLRTFLEEQVITQEALLSAKGDPFSTGKPSEKTDRAHAHHVKRSGPQSRRTCPICQKEHSLWTCEKYKQKSAKERRALVDTYKLYFNCLG